MCFSVVQCAFTYFAQRPVPYVPLPAARLEAYLRSGRALVLTDDFAPVDQLLATLFVERGRSL